MASSTQLLRLRPLSTYHYGDQRLAKINAPVFRVRTIRIHPRFRAFLSQLLTNPTCRHLRPGGWFEMQEVFHFPLSASRTRPLAPDHPVVQYWTLINEGLTNLGITNFHGAANGQLAAMMRDVGFVNVTERVLQIPIGTWPKNKVLKTVGLYWRTILVDGMQAIALGPLTRGCGWTQAQVELFLTQVRRAYQDNSMLAYMPLHIVYGQKPEGY